MQYLGLAAEEISSSEKEGKIYFLLSI